MSMAPGKKWKRSQTTAEEIANAVTHGAGALVSIAAATLLITFASLESDAWKIVAVSIYGATLFLLFLASTLYHSIPHEGAKQALKLFDHSAIYLLIAGTYTPFLLVSMRTTLGWTLFILVWTIAIAGIFLKLRHRDRYHRFHVVNYVALGWIAAIAMPQFTASLPETAMDLIVAGGVVYTVGVVFYVLDRIPFAHSIWHLFVLGGSTCHYIAVYHSVIR